MNRIRNAGTGEEQVPLYIRVYCDMRDESRNNPLPENGSVTRFRDKPERPFARQRFGKHRLKAAIVEPDKELSVLLGNGSCTFLRQRIHEEP
jgi:hypothetical protein